MNLRSPQHRRRSGVATDVAGAFSLSRRRRGKSDPCTATGSVPATHRTCCGYLAHLAGTTSRVSWQRARALFLAGIRPAAISFNPTEGGATWTDAPTEELARQIAQHDDIKTTRKHYLDPVLPGDVAEYAQTHG